MYARSYENLTQAQDVRPLPSGYSGVTFESEDEAPPAEQVSLPLDGKCEPKEERPFSSLFSKIPFLQRLMPQQGGLFGSLFADTEDILLLGLFLLLLLSKDGDPLCAVAILILFFSDKI